MKKIIYLVMTFLILSHSVFSMEIQGGVKYDVDSAREYLQEGQSNNAEITGHYKFEAKNTEKVVYSYNNAGDIVGITVQYINEPTKGYIYDKRGNLIFMDKYDRSVNLYPHRGYRYKMDGSIDLATLTVSSKEQFRFTPDGRLLAHALNGIIYDENKNIIGSSK